MSLTNPQFFLVHHQPKYDSFAVICFEGIPQLPLPEGFKRLLPGNQDGVHDGVQVEQNKYLAYLMKALPEWFENVELIEVNQIDGIQYRLVQHYLMM